MQGDSDKCSCVLQAEVFAALNSALAPLGIRITSAGPKQWSVSDGKSLTRFQDGMVRPALPWTFCDPPAASNNDRRS